MTEKGGCLYIKKLPTSDQTRGEPMENLTKLMVTECGFRIKQFPNGEFTIGYVPPKKFDVKGLKEPTAPTNGQQWWFQNPEKWKAFVCNEIINESQEDPLDLTLPANSHKRGLKGITTHGARLVRNSAFLLQTRYTNRCLSFLTLTMPPMSRDEYICIASQWSEIVRKVVQEIGRELKRYGLSGNVVGVTEIQSKRLERKWGLGLHLHLVFQGRKRFNVPWAIDPIWFRECWLRMLSQAVGRRVVSSSCENIKMVKRNAGAYLGKYLTKGKQVIGQVVEEYGAECVPSSWYTCSLNLRHAVERCTRMAWDSEVNVVARLPELSLKDLLKWIAVHQIEFHGRQFTVGFSGVFNMNILHKLDPTYYTRMCHYDPTGI